MRAPIALSLVTLLVLSSCAPRAALRPRVVPVPVDPLALLVSAVPMGATACVAVRTGRVVDRRRPFAARLSRAGALAWARHPHVSAYVRCDIGTNDARVELVSIDEIDLSDRSVVREALGFSVRFAGDTCEHDECDLPLVEVVSGALRITRRSAEGVLGPGVERLLSGWMRERPDAVEIAVRAEGVRLVLPAADGLSVVENADEGSVSELSSWEELEFAAEDRRISHEAWGARAEGHLADVSDLASWTSEFALAQLNDRVVRARRGVAPSDEERGAIEAICRHTFAHWAGDFALVEPAARALLLVGADTEVLGLIDGLTLSAAGDVARLDALTRLGREVAVLAHDESVSERLRAGGIIADADAAARAVESLVALVETFGVTYESAEEAVRAAEAEPPETPSAVPVDVLISARALFALLWVSIGEREANLDAEVWLRGDALVVPAARSSPGLTLVPSSGGLFIRATGRARERVVAIAEIVESALGASGGIDLVIRLRGEGGVRVGRASGTSDAAGLHVRLTSALAGVPAELVERALAGPLSQLLARRFPAPRLTWARVEGDPSTAALERALRAASIRGCEVGPIEIACEPAVRGASDGLDMVIAVASALGARP